MRYLTLTAFACLLSFASFGQASSRDSLLVQAGKSYNRAFVFGAAATGLSITTLLLTQNADVSGDSNSDLRFGRAMGYGISGILLIAAGYNYVTGNNRLINAGRARGLSYGIGLGSAQLSYRF